MDSDDGPRTRSTLMQRLRNREDAKAWNEAWVEFQQIYSVLVRRYLSRRFNLSGDDADEVWQKVLLGVMKLIDDEKYRRDKLFRGWLFTVAWRTASRHVGGRGRRPLTGQDAALGNAVGREPGPDDLQEWNELRLSIAVERALEKVRLEVSDKAWRAFEITSVKRETGTDGNKYYVVSETAFPGTVATAARELGWDAARVSREKLKVKDRVMDVLLELKMLD
jgi:DNA-directed RNA polymerase specialized sigma24 family protein